MSQGAIGELEHQRNIMASRAAFLAGQLADTAEALKEVTDRLKAAEERIAELEAEAVSVDPPSDA